jgi:hypothetical protein
MTFAAGAPGTDGAGLSRPGAGAIAGGAPPGTRLCSIV